MSSETSTEDQAPFTAGHFYVLLSMIAATVAVVVARNTHPAALLLISAAVIVGRLWRLPSVWRRRRAATPAA